MMPRPVKNEGLPQHHHPGALGQLDRGVAAPARRGQVIDSDMSAAGSRSTRNAVPVPGRSVDLGDLALDPDDAEPVDPLGDLRSRPRGPATGSPRIRPCAAGRGHLAVRAGDPVGQQGLERGAGRGRPPRTPAALRARRRDSDCRRARSWASVRPS